MEGLTLPDLDTVAGDLIGAFSEQLRECWGTKFFNIKGRSELCFDRLFSREDFIKLVEVGSLRYPAIRIAHSGKVLDLADFSRSDISISGAALTNLIDLTKINRLMQQGATVILQGLHRHHLPLRNFCAHMEAEFGHPFQINGYFTPKSSFGFNRHADTHDVLVFQIYGEKRWKVYSQDPSEEGAAHRPIFFGNIVAGDVMYIPRGFEHSAEADDSESLHLTIGIRSYTITDVWKEFSKAIEQKLTMLPMAQNGLPPNFHINPEALDLSLLEASTGIPHAQFQDTIQALRKRFCETRSPLVVPAFRTSGLDTAADTKQRFRAPPNLPVFVSVDGIHCTVIGNGVSVDFPARAQRLVQSILDGAPHQIEDFTEDYTHDAIAATVRVLIEHGLLEIAR